MSSNAITGTTEKDGSITINGSTGSKEFKIGLEYQMERKDLVSRQLTVNVTADTAEDAINWTRMYQDEIDDIAREKDALQEWDFDDDPSMPYEFGDKRVNERECLGEVLKSSD